MRLKKLLAGITAAALAVSAMAFSSLSASAEDDPVEAAATWSGEGNAYTFTYTGEVNGNVTKLTQAQLVPLSDLLPDGKTGKDVRKVSFAVSEEEGSFTGAVGLTPYDGDASGEWTTSDYSASVKTGEIETKDGVASGEVQIQIYWCSAKATAKVTLSVELAKEEPAEPEGDEYIAWTAGKDKSTYTVTSTNGYDGTAKNETTVASKKIAIKDILAKDKTAKDVKEVKVTASGAAEGTKITVGGKYTSKEGTEAPISKQCAFSDKVTEAVLGISEGQGLLGDDITLTVESLPKGAKVTITVSFEYKEVADTDEPEAGSDGVEIALTKTSDGILTFPYSELAKYDELVVTYKPALGTACGHTGHNAGETYCTWAKIAFCGSDAAGKWIQPDEKTIVAAATSEDKEVCTATVKVSKIIASFGDTEIPTICLGEWSAALVKLVGIPKSEQSGTDTPVDDGLTEKVNATGKYEVTKLDDDGLFIIPVDGSDNVLTATYGFAPEDKISVKITPAEGVDSSKWKILLKGFDNSWGGWKSLEGEEGSLTLTGTIKDIMDANSMSSISDLQGFLFQIAGTAVGDKFDYELIIRGKKVTAPSSIPENNAPTVTPSVPSAPSAGIPGAVIKPKAPAASSSSSASGNTSVTLKDSTKLSKDVIDSVSGKKNVEFKLDNGASWEIEGADAAKAEGMDLGITLDTKAATADQVKEVAKDNDTFQFSLNHSGDFGFTAVINVPVDAKYNGQFANLYWFHDGKFDFIGSSKVEKGVVDFRMTHASDYVIVFDDEAYGEDVSSAAGVYEESETASAAPIAIVVTLAALAVSAVILKKRVF